MAAVSTIVPVFWVHAPCVPSFWDVEDTVWVPELPVWAPVMVATVTVEPVASAKLQFKTIVMVLVAPAMGLFCSMVFTLKTGTTTLSGSSPLGIPSSVAPVVVIEAEAIAPTVLPLPSFTTAATVMAGEDCALQWIIQVVTAMQ